MQPTELFPVTDFLENYAAVISKCIKTKNLKLGKQIHSYLIKTGFVLNTFITNRLIDLYSKCNSIECAQKAFNDLPVKNTHSWNTIISAYSQMGWFSKSHQLLNEMPEPNLVSYNSIISSLTRHGYYKESINMFKIMQYESGRNSLSVDAYTVVSVVNSCACLGALEFLRQVHGVAIMRSLIFNVLVCNAFIHAYGKCRKPECSHMVFSEMHERDIVSWTSMVVAYVQACKLVNAFQVFNQMPFRNVVSWTALIAGLSQYGQGDSALYLFSQMLEDGVVPSGFTYVSVLNACADLGLIERGKQLHGRIIRVEHSSDHHNVYVINALVDMYSKCGDMRSTMSLFDRFPNKDVVTWNSVITGFAQNGQAELSLAIFEEMVERNVKPNQITFLGVLSACCHTGLVLKGLQLLKTMEKDFGVIPRVDHYAILIDLLGRKNQLREALELIERAPHCADHIGMWGALLSSCRIHGNKELARRAAEALFELEPDNAARYVMLSNIYTAAGQWDDARRIRRLMDERGLKKDAACSWIEMRNIKHEFVSNDKLHFQIEEIKKMLHKLDDLMKDTGYVHLIESLFFPDDDRVT